MDELRSSPDRPHEGDQPLRRDRETDAETGWRRQAIEPRSRSEYAADLNPDGPFATLIRVAATYCDPEVDAGAYDDLKYLACQDDDAELRVFKAELREALADPRRLPDDELFRAVDYSDGSDEKFLRRLWHDLYGDEPVTES